MKTIIAVDDGTAVPCILEFVKKHKWDEHARFRVIHVISPVMLDHPMASYPLFLESVQKESFEAGQKLLKRVLTEMREFLPTQEIEVEILEGFAKECILDEAATWKADLIVVGSHGRTGLSRFFLGSVSSAVVTHAPCSVMIVRIPQERQEVKEPVKAVGKSLATT